MKHSSSQAGSVVVIVILVLSAVAVWCLALLKSADLHNDMAFRRQEREQVSQLAEGVMRYGIWLCKTRFSTVLKKEDKYNFVVGSWKIDGKKSYTGMLQCLVQEGAVYLRAQLYDAHKTCVHTITCQLARQHEKEDAQVLVVRNWVAQGNVHGREE